MMPRTQINRPLTHTAVLLVLILFSGTVSSAQSRYYHSGNTSPFVKMMLIMMDAMGVLDRVPGYGGYGPYGYSSSPYAVSPWNRYQNNPFVRTPWGGSSWGNSPWARTPWGYSGAGINSPIWGSPDWGVLPVEGYYYNNYKPYTTRWSADELDGWVKEPWEASEWNPEAVADDMDNRWSLSDSALQQRKQTAAPIVQNFNLNVADNVGDDTGRDQQLHTQKLPDNQMRDKQKRGDSRSGVEQDRRLHGEVNKGSSRHSHSPLARLRRSPSHTGDARHNRQDGAQPERPVRPEKPCITEFCGLRKPDIDGFWVTQDGEMLGIKNNRYLWSDGGTRNLTGQLKLQNEYLLMKVDGYEKLKRFKYKLAGDHLLTMQPDGKIREFMRTPNNYSGQYPAQRYGW